MKAKTRVTALAAIMGILEVDKPNISHSRVPKVKSPYMDREMEEVFFV
jgi:hypothetical protein